MLKRLTTILLIALLYSGISFSQFDLHIKFNEKKEKKGCDSISLALFNRMLEEPNDTMKSHICTLINGLVDSAIWDKLDCFYMLAVSDTNKAHLNWVKDAHNLTPYGKIKFTPYGGYKGDGFTGFLNTNYTPDTDGLNFGPGDCQFGVYNRIDNNNNCCDIGGGSDSSILDLTLFTIKDSSSQFKAHINLFVSYEGKISNPLGLISARRSEGLTALFVNEASINRGGGFFNGRSSTVPVYIFARNKGTKKGNFAQEFSNREFSCVYFSAALTDRETKAFFKLVETYLDAIGAGLVP